MTLTRPSPCNYMHNSNSSHLFPIQCALVYRHFRQASQLVEFLERTGEFCCYYDYNHLLDYMQSLVVPPQCIWCVFLKQWYSATLCTPIQKYQGQHDQCFSSSAQISAGLRSNAWLAPGGSMYQLHPQPHPLLLPHVWDGTDKTALPQMRGAHLCGKFTHLQRLQCSHSFQQCSTSYIWSTAEILEQLQAHFICLAVAFILKLDGVLKS